MLLKETKSSGTFSPISFPASADSHYFFGILLHCIWIGIGGLIYNKSFISWLHKHRSHLCRCIAVTRRINLGDLDSWSSRITPCKVNVRTTVHSVDLIRYPFIIRYAGAPWPYSIPGRVAEQTPCFARVLPLILLGMVVNPWSVFKIPA